MEMDAIAAAMRLALLGTSAELAVPFEQLKPEIRDRWRMVVDVAQGPVLAERDSLNAATKSLSEQLADATVKLAALAAEVEMPYDTSLIVQPVRLERWEDEALTGEDQ